MRDGLVQKLITLTSLSNEMVNKASKQRSEEGRNSRSYLSNPENIKRYREKLQRKEVKYFYNLSSDHFLNLLSQRTAIVQACKALDNHQLNRFADR